MDPLDLRLQDVIGDLEVGVLRVVDCTTASAADRGRALDLRATLDRMRDAVVTVGEPAAGADVPSDIDARVDALRRRAGDLVAHDDPPELPRIDDALDETLRVMSMVGKWPPPGR